MGLHCICVKKSALEWQFYLFFPFSPKNNLIYYSLPERDYPLEGKVGVVAGWGKTDNSFGKTGTNLLNKVRKMSLEKV